MHRTFPNVKSTLLLWDSGTRADQAKLLLTMPDCSLGNDTPEGAELLRKVIEFDPGDDEDLQFARSQKANDPIGRLLCTLVLTAINEGASAIQIKPMSDEDMTTSFFQPPSNEFESQEIADLCSKLASAVESRFGSEPGISIVFVIDGTPRIYMNLPANLKDPLWQEIEFATTCRADRYFDRGDIKIPLATFEPQITRDLITISIVQAPSESS